jgi:hypothetical protein
LTGAQLYRAKLCQILDGGDLGIFDDHGELVLAPGAFEGPPVVVRLVGLDMGKPHPSAAVRATKPIGAAWR